MGNTALPAGVVSACSPAANRILCYGDGLTAGYSHSNMCFTPYASALSGALGCEVSHCGLSGFTSRQMLVEIDAAKTSLDICGRSGSGLAWLLDHSERHDLVLLMLGTDDLELGMTEGSIVKCVRELHAVCHARGVPSIVLLPPSLHPTRGALAYYLRKWAGAEPLVLTVVDPEEVVPREVRHYWDSDAVHLSPEGYIALGNRIVSDVKAALATFQKRQQWLERLRSNSLKKCGHSLRSLKNCRYNK